MNVDTVDGFQGNEKDVIIISMVRSGTTKDIQFVADSKRLNVTLTRARKKLIIIGNTKTLKQKKIYKKMIKFCEKNSALRYYDKNIFKLNFQLCPHLSQSTYTVYPFWLQD